MRKSKIFLIILGFGALCVIYYCLSPKYQFWSPEGAFVYRGNRITGKVQLGTSLRGKWIWVDLTGRRKKQKP